MVVDLVVLDLEPLDLELPFVSPSSLRASLINDSLKDLLLDLDLCFLVFELMRDRLPSRRSDDLVLSREPLLLLLFLSFWLELADIHSAFPFVHLLNQSTIQSMEGNTSFETKLSVISGFNSEETQGDCVCNLQKFVVPGIEGISGSSADRSTLNQANSQRGICYVIKPSDCDFLIETDR